MLVGPILGKVALGGAAVAAAFVAKDAWHYFSHKDEISQGGSPHGSITGKIMGMRHLFWFGVRNAWHPGTVKVAYSAEADARKAEHELFHGGRNKNGYDSAPDAYRHTYASALIAYRLITKSHLSPDRAAKYAWNVGLGHELDSHLLGIHRGYSGAMDAHNNSVGIAIGVRQAMLGIDPAQADELISGAVMAAIKQGDTVVMDTTTTVPRPSTARDLDRDMWRDAPVGVEPSGKPSFTVVPGTPNV